MEPETARRGAATGGRHQARPVSHHPHRIRGTRRQVTGSGSYSWGAGFSPAYRLRSAGPTTVPHVPRGGPGAGCPCYRLVRRLGGRHENAVPAVQQWVNGTFRRNANPRCAFAGTASKITATSPTCRACIATSVGASARTPRCRSSAFTTSKRRTNGRQNVVGLRSVGSCYG